MLPFPAGSERVLAPATERGTSEGEHITSNQRRNGGREEPAPPVPRSPQMLLQFGGGVPSFLTADKTLARNFLSVILWN